MRPGKLIRTPILLAVGLFLTFTMSMTAQVQSQTTTSKEPFTRIVEVEKGEVVYVSGNDLILKMEDGEIRHIANVPESARATVDGKEIGIHDVKVGMKLQKTITTTTTPTVITKVETVTGKVFHVTPPTSVILTLEDGTNQEFKIPKDQKFNVDGQMVRLRSQRGDEDLSDKGHGDSGDRRYPEDDVNRQDATSAASAARCSNPDRAGPLVVR